MRDHRKLRAFELADGLVLAIYDRTRLFPKDEQFGLTSQLRRCAVSVASNIVEDCARNSEPDYIRFLDMAFGSVRELEYHFVLARRSERRVSADFTTWSLSRFKMTRAGIEPAPAA